MSGLISRFGSAIVSSGDVFLHVFLVAKNKAKMNLG